MSIEILVLVALLLNILIVLIVLYLVYKGDKALGEFTPYLRDAEAMRHTIARRGNDILQRTITVAQEIIRNAIATSQKNLRLSEAFQREMEEQIQSGVAQNTSEAKQMIQNATADIIESYRNQFLAMSKDIETAGLQVHDQLLGATKTKIDDLASGIKEEISQVRKGVEEKMSQKLIEAEVDIKAYKEAKIKEVDQKIYQILDEVAKQTLGRGLDLSTHEDLVIDSLDRAKKDNVF